MGLSLLLLSTAPYAAPAEIVTFTVPAHTEDDLQAKLRAASLLQQSLNDPAHTAQDLFAAALADYRRLTEVLYANGYYSGVIAIKLNGREAARFPATQPPRQIDQITVEVDPGKPFRFGNTALTPLPEGFEKPPAFQKGERARATAVINAAKEAQRAWRNDGHAKVRVTGQSLRVDHADKRFDAAITLTPGPAVRFGTLRVDGPKAVREDRIREIAGLPTEERFSPAEVEKAANRLRRSGAFRSVALREADALRDRDVLDINADLVDAPPRRFGAGIEVATETGLQLSGFWLHRNLLGGAERLRIEGMISDITTEASRIDYALGVRLDRPASFGPDTTTFVRLDTFSDREPLYDLDLFEIAVGASRDLQDALNGQIELSLTEARANTSFGRDRFRLVSLALQLERDRRDDPLDAKTGYFLSGSATPYLGLNGAESGAQLKLDGRIYRPILQDRLIAAARLQFGSVLGSSIAGTSPNLLFHSGGGGTVRGHAFQSLGVGSGSNRTGGRSFLGVSTELRGKINDKLSLVGFADAGYVGPESVINGNGEWHAGAGLGLRYNTSVGPIRLDIGGPIRGSGSKRLQFYIGIGQAF